MRRSNVRVASADRPTDATNTCLEKKRTDLHCRARYIACVSEPSLNVVRAFVAVAGLVAGPSIAFAVPVTWEAQGRVESSDLGSDIFADFMPELVGTESGDTLVLRISFDTDAPLIGAPGGPTYSFDASSLVLALEVPGRGTHVFTIDDTVPPATIPSLIGITDDLVTPEMIFDSLQFRHNYFTEAGVLQFFILAVFSTTDLSVLSGGNLPLSPDPRLVAGFEHELSIVAPGNGNLLAIFTSLVLVPTTIPEPGSLALLCLGVAGLWAARRGHAGSAG